jgi:hypothetical protein
MAQSWAPKAPTNEAAAGGGTRMLQETDVAFFSGHIRVGEAARDFEGGFRAEVEKIQYETQNGDVRIITNGAAISTPAKTAVQSTAKIVLLRQDMVPSPVG